MRYRETAAQSAEYLRLALQHMTRHDAAMHPVSYALWYEYVAGINPELKSVLDAVTAAGERLSDEAAYALYQRLVADLDADTVERFSGTVRQIVAVLADSASHAGDRASQFGTALQRWSEALSNPHDATGTLKAIEGILNDTKAMQESIGQLRTQLARSIKEAEGLRQEVSRAREEALVDALTGLANRKGFDRALASCLDQWQSKATSLCLLMADIDHFKSINDSYGHLFGDKVLRAVGQALKANLKGRDTASRYGGEEFAVILPETPLAGATRLAESLRGTIANSRIKRLDSDEVIDKITISIGVAAYHPGETGREFVGRADKALYASKTRGRNRVTTA